MKREKQKAQLIRPIVVLIKVGAFGALFAPVGMQKKDRLLLLLTQMQYDRTKVY